DRAVAVLRDAGSRCSGDECRRSRDVERLAAVAAGARGVDEVVALRLHRQHVRAHRLGAAGDLVGRLALQPQRDEEAADLRRRGLARHDRVHDLARPVAAEVAALQQLAERVLDHERKFLARSLPTGVRTDSGWNCTPSIGSSRWRTAITSPSAAVAETSSESGSEVAASEW